MSKLLKKASDSISKRQEVADSPLYIPINTSMLLSSGCTLLDLAISGGRVRGGGIPGGILMEVFGTSGSGKTAILVETAVSAQLKGGEASFQDPEARLDHEYARIYGMNITELEYSRPSTVTEVFENIENWNPENKKVIHVCAVDSLAALSTNLELEDGDKMGMRRAKEFSEGCRKMARKIAEENKLVICSNQVRQSQYGKKAPGGEAIPFYASVRLSMNLSKKIEQKKKIGGSKKEHTRIIGIESDIEVVKNSVDNPFRKCKIYILFGIGIDDIRGNLQFLKDTNGVAVYEAVDAEFKSMSAAIQYIEKNNYEKELRQQVIERWQEVENAFKTKRKAKVRF